MKYRKGYKYQLAADEGFPSTGIVPSRYIETEFITLTTSGDLMIRSGYAWDGASGPTLDTKDSLRASLAHDALYQLLRWGHLDQRWREPVDDYFGRLLEEDGMWWWRRKLWVRELKKFGAPAASVDNKKRVYEAP